MNNEYVIINKTEILKRIEKLEEEYKSEPAHQFNTYVGKLMKEIMIEIMILKQILSQSTPLIPESIKPLQELVDEDVYYSSAPHLQVQRMLKVIQDYISNLKLDI